MAQTGFDFDLGLEDSLERSVRLFVAEGACLDRHDVIEGNPGGQRPKGPYATVLLVDDIALKSQGTPIRRAVHADETLDLQSVRGQVGEMVYRRATYSVQFYRKTAVARAKRFDQWATSQNGLRWARTAFVDGRLAHIKVLTGGSGYAAPPGVVIDGAGGSGATAAAAIVRGAVAAVYLTGRGRGFVDVPNISFVGDATEEAVATAVGFGFVVVFPLRVVRLDEIIGDAFEERAYIQLPIDYAAVHIQDAGQIDAIECAIILDGVGEIVRETSRADT